MVNNLPANGGDTEDMGSFPGLGGFPAEGNDNSLQYSSWKNGHEEPGQRSLDRGSWQATVHGVARSQT